MILVLLIISSLFLGLCVSEDSYEVVCYGGTYRFPGRFTFQLHMGRLYLTPSDGGPRRLLVDKGKAKHSHIKINSLGFSLQNVKAEDEGTFSIENDGQTALKIATIKVSNCIKEVTRNYGEAYDFPLKGRTDFLEFSPAGRPNQMTVLWNVLDPEFNANSRGRIEDYSWRVSDLTQKDNGLYRFWNQDNAQTDSLRLTVKEHVKNFKVDEDESIEIVHPCLAHMRMMTFTPKGQDRPSTVLKDGRVVSDYWFNSRLQVVTNGIEVFRLEGGDSGTFEFRDSEGNLIMVAHLVVNDYFILDVIYYVSFLLMIPVSFIFCCCYCIMKKRYKWNVYADRPIAVPDQNQPAAPSYSAAPSSSAVSHQSARVQRAKVPAVSSSKPPVYQPVKSCAIPTQSEAQTQNIPQVAPPEKQEPAPAPPTSSNFLSPDSEPTFELKGVTFSSGPSLTSDSAAPAVYTSDKLNFL